MPDRSITYVRAKAKEALLSFGMQNNSQCFRCNLKNDSVELNKVVTNISNASTQCKLIAECFEMWNFHQEGRNSEFTVTIVFAGDEGRKAFEQSQLSAHGFQGIQVRH